MPSPRFTLPIYIVRLGSTLSDQDPHPSLIRSTHIPAYDIYNGALGAYSIVLTGGRFILWTGNSG